MTMQDFTFVSKTLGHEHLSSNTFSAFNIKRFIDTVHNKKKVLNIFLKLPKGTTELHMKTCQWQCQHSTVGHSSTHNLMINSLHVENTISIF